MQEKKYNNEIVNFILAIYKLVINIETYVTRKRILGEIKILTSKIQQKYQSDKDVISKSS